MRHSVPTPKSSTGWLWLAAGLFAIFTIATQGGDVGDGFSEGFGDTCAPFFAAEPGRPPARLSPACDSNGTRYAGVQPTSEVAGTEAATP